MDVMVVSLIVYIRKKMLKQYFLPNLYFNVRTIYSFKDFII